jgi:hypothetical protein
MHHELSTKSSWAARLDFGKCEADVDSQPSRYIAPDRANELVRRIRACSSRSGQASRTLDVRLATTTPAKVTGCLLPRDIGHVGHLTICWRP